MSFRPPLFFIKWARFEYWPWWVFYLPLVPYLVWTALRTGSPKFFAWANPGMWLGGLIGESKASILATLPPSYLPQSLFFDWAQWPHLTQASARAAHVQQAMQQRGLAFPVVAKPNVGERGTHVEKITDAAGLTTYLAAHSHPLIVQEFVDYPIELGVFYSRLPNQPQGQVSSVTLKRFLAVQGNGQATVRQLLAQNDRARFQLPRLEAKLGPALDQVVPAGTQLVVEPIGNHCRGTEFINANHLINKRLQQVFDQIAAGVDGFYYGRFDLKVPSLEHLYAGEQIKILELNGVASEPAHIYHPGYPLWQAYRDVLWHWRRVRRICQHNMALAVPLAASPLKAPPVATAGN